MNLRASTLQQRRRLQRAFTMLEIALALGVIAFALVAIIGILPVGLQTQRDNREETIVNQDARLLVEAIKTGGRDWHSDLGAFVADVDGTNFANGLETSNLVSLLSDVDRRHAIRMRAISGAIANRESDLAFQYQILSSNLPIEIRFVGVNPTNLNQLITNVVQVGTEIRLRFAWPILPNNNISPDANVMVTRLGLTGYSTNGLMYLQEYRR